MMLRNRFEVPIGAARMKPERCALCGAAASYASAEAAYCSNCVETLAQEKLDKMKWDDVLEWLELDPIGVE